MNDFKLTKESQKCIKYVLNNNLLLNNFAQFQKNVTSSKFINNTKNIIHNVHKHQHKKQHINHPKKISLGNKYPLTYKLFMCAYKHKIIDLLIENLSHKQKLHINDILKNNNIKKFTIFYNEHQHLFNYDKLNNYVKQKHNADILKILQLMNINEPIYKLLYDNPFMPLDVQFDAEQNDLNYDEYKLEDGSEIHLYTYSNKPHNINIDIICNLIYIVKNIAKRSEPVKLNIFNSDKKKHLNKVNYDCNCKHLSPVNINTGSTLKLKFINIWRNEEMNKVLIHELVHYYDIDMDIYSAKSIMCDNMIKKLFNITPNSDDYVNESYTEIVALIINTLYISYISSIDFFLLLWLEVSFNMIQVTKIISYYELSHSRCILQKSSNCNENKISQSTSVLSYFIIKCCVINNLCDILNFLDNGVKFGDRESEYMELINKALTNDTFYEYIDKNIKNIQINDFDTLRMTCLQIE